MKYQQLSLYHVLHTLRRSLRKTRYQPRKLWYHDMGGSSPACTDQGHREYLKYRMHAYIAPILSCYTYTYIYIIIHIVE
jgi:hypothetical protein